MQTTNHRLMPNMLRAMSTREKVAAALAPHFGWKGEDWSFRPRGDFHPDSKIGRVWAATDAVMAVLEQTPPDTQPTEEK